MNNTASPIIEPHPIVTAPDQKVVDSVLIYAGPGRGRWIGTEPQNALTQVSHDPIGNSEPDPSNETVGYSEFRLALSPTPHISWQFQYLDSPNPSNWPVPISPSNLTLEFTTRSGTTSRPKTSKYPWQYVGTSPIPSPIEIGGVDTPLDEIRFYLINFQVMQLIESVHRGNNPEHFARLQLHAAGWTIEIESRPNDEFFHATHHLENQRGYAITHTCRIEKESDNIADGPFTFEEGQSVLEATQLFLSFVRGGMVGIALPVGLRNGISEFEQWSVTQADPGRYRDPHQSKPYPGWYLWWDHPPLNRKAATWLPPMFEKFAVKWWHPDHQIQDFWRRVFREVIFSYTDAERMEQTRAIVPVCTALETLGWAILVEMEGWLTGANSLRGVRSGYERLAAADRLRLLLHWAGLPIQVPESLPKLWHEAKGHGNWDGPQIVYWTRNLVVHPDTRARLSNGVAVETWLLAMWYAELIVLKLLNYEGYFKDRLDSEEIKRVPWATERSTPE